MKGSSGFAPGFTPGFTLVELVVTVAVAAILLSIAIPSFTRTLVSARLSTSANEVTAALSQARLEAIRRNQLTQFCGAANNGSDQLGGDCASATGAVRTLDPAGTSSTLIRDALLLPSDVTLGSLNPLRYDGTGVASAPSGGGPYTGLVADIYSQRIRTNNHACVYLTTGSIVSTHTCSSACPANEPTSSC
ncbi:MAG: prepilin-type N-terminal cleavage/methylation domain-containing protein [Nevskia sp.]|nr:prepilin-type N-terminal cleavage/methylation domain-containing protein [Nevskia sp.]